MSVGGPKIDNNSVVRTRPIHMVLEPIPNRKCADEDVRFLWGVDCGDLTKRVLKALETWQANRCTYASHIAWGRQVVVLICAELTPYIETRFEVKP